MKGFQIPHRITGSTGPRSGLDTLEKRLSVASIENRTRLRPSSSLQPRPLGTDSGTALTVDDKANIMQTRSHESGQDEGSYEHGYEGYGSTESGEFLYLFRHYQLIKNSVQVTM